ncbi:MAG TPA: (d)CMP kinase [Flavobacteriaceae bacterium]|nr:(d)CMP kinase [Flavobacteriaceae bacterium]
MKNTIIAIDGEASSGKSTQAKKIADYLGYSYLDSGAFYRAITLFFKRKEITSATSFNKNELDEISLNSNYNNGKNSIYLNGDDVSDDIRSVGISEIVSDFAKEKEVREHVYKHLRELSKNQSIVIDGRDIGTVVFPNADFKFFLYANPEIRAKRRFSEIDKDEINYKSVLDNLKYRDITDSTRDIAPLKKAHDAYSIDVSELSIDQVFKKLMNIIEK